MRMTKKDFITIGASVVLLAIWIVWVVLLVVLLGGAFTGGC